MIPARGKILVTPVETEQTMPGGSIILIDDTREKLSSHQMIILATGKPEFCSHPEDCNYPEHEGEGEERVHPHDPLLVEGAWVFVQPRSLVPASDRDKHYLVRPDDILGVFTE